MEEWKVRKCFTFSNLTCHATTHINTFLQQNCWHYGECRLDYLKKITKIKIDEILLFRFWKSWITKIWSILSTAFAMIEHFGSSWSFCRAVPSLTSSRRRRWRSLRSRPFAKRCAHDNIVKRISETQTQFLRFKSCTYPYSAILSGPGSLHMGAS